MFKLSSDKNTKGTRIAVLAGVTPKQYVYMKSGFDHTDGGGWSNEIKIDKGKLEAVPRTDIVEKLYISGNSGSGKTYNASKWIEKYLKMFKNEDAEFYLFSLVDSDETLDRLDPVRIDIDDTLITDPIPLEDFSDSVVVFDDSEMVPSKQLKSMLFNMMDKLITMGRHTRSRVIIITHQISNYKETRLILAEATSITIFPRYGAVSSIKKMLETHIGLNKNQIAKVLKLPSRYVSIYKYGINYILYEKGILGIDYL